MTDILIADDHPIFRKGLKDILESMLSDSTIHEAADGEEVVTFLSQSTVAPNIFILDIDMPRKNGIEVCKHIKQLDPKAKVIILTMHNQEDIFFEAMEAKADGFVLKENSARELAQCMDEIDKGGIYVSHDLKNKQADFSSHQRKKNDLKAQLSDLSQAELKTLQLVSQGFTSKEIAEVMFVTSKSVDNYRSRICKKLNIEAGSNALINWVVENKALLKDLKDILD